MQHRASWKPGFSFPTTHRDTTLAKFEVKQLIRVYEGIRLVLHVENGTACRSRKILTVSVTVNVLEPKELCCLLEPSQKEFIHRVCLLYQLIQRSKNEGLHTCFGCARKNREIWLSGCHVCHPCSGWWEYAARLCALGACMP